MLPCKLRQLRHPCHRAIFVHDLADDARPLALLRRGLGARRARAAVEQQQLPRRLPGQQARRGGRLRRRRRRCLRLRLLSLPPPFTRLRLKKHPLLYQLVLAVDDRVVLALLHHEIQRIFLMCLFCAKNETLSLK